MGEVKKPQTVRNSQRMNDGYILAVGYDLADERKRAGDGPALPGFRARTRMGGPLELARLSGRANRLGRAAGGRHDGPGRRRHTGPEPGPGPGTGRGRDRPGARRRALRP